MIGWIIRFIVRKFQEHLAELQRQIDEYNQKKAAAEAQQAGLRRDIETVTASNAELAKQLTQQKADREVLQQKLKDEISAADQTAKELKDALTPKPKPRLPDDAELERLSERTGRA